MSEEIHEFHAEWTPPPEDLYKKGYQVALIEYAALERGEAPPHDHLNPDLNSERYRLGYSAGMKSAIDADPEMAIPAPDETNGSRAEEDAKAYADEDFRAATANAFRKGYEEGARSGSRVAQSYQLIPPEPINLAAEGQAIAELLTTLSKVSDTSKGRVLGAVVGLSQTSGPFTTKTGFFEDPPAPDTIAENLERLARVHGTIRDEDDDGTP